MFNVKKAEALSSFLIVRHLAFTLAEVLITIGIIGVVAAITIPAVIQHSIDQNAVVQLKKAYATLSNAYNMAVADNGTPSNWGLTSSTHYDSAIGLKILNYLKPYLKVEKDCGTSSVALGCFPNTVYSYKNGASWTTWVNIDSNGSQFAKIRLADGMSLAGQYPEANTNCNISRGNTPALQSICGYLYIDVDGVKGASKLSVDLFGFYLTNFGIIPIGTVAEDPTTGMAFSNACVTGNGWGCTAWVLYNGNMDYLQCPTSLSWTGAKTCP